MKQLAIRVCTEADLEMLAVLNKQRMSSMIIR